jgi:hypothetical protein
MQCSCGVTFERSVALIAHLTDDHMDAAPQEFREEWLAA